MMPLPCAILMGVVLGVVLVCMLFSLANAGHKSMHGRYDAPPRRVVGGYQPQGDAATPPPTVSNHPSSVLPPNHGSNGVKQ